MKQSASRTETITSLFDQYADNIYRYARYCLPPDIDARDVVQEVFLRAFRSWHEFKGDSEPKTWLFRIARNYIYDLLRQKRRRRIHEIRNHTTDGSIQFEGSTRLDTLLELEDALTRLQPNHQQVLNLCWIQDLTVSETAQVLGWSEAKVRINFHRAKIKLKQELLGDAESTWSEQRTGGDVVHGKGE